MSDTGSRRSTLSIIWDGIYNETKLDGIQRQSDFGVKSDLHAQGYTKSPGSYRPPKSWEIREFGGLEGYPRETSRHANENTLIDWPRVSSFEVDNTG